MALIKPKKERLLKDGWYPATIGDVEERETKFGERLFMPFEINADGDVVAIDTFISISDHPKSNMCRWAKQLFGEGDFDYDNFAGQNVAVFIDEGESNDGEPKNFIRKLKPAESETGGGGKAKGKKDDVEVDESDFEDIPF